MIFIAKADGTLSRVIPSAVNQGSVGVNELVLIAPYPKVSAVTAAFILPNGIRTKPNLATITEIPDVIEDTAYNAWVFELTSAITEYAGNVTVQFYVTSANGVLATYSDTFTVAKGVMPEMPDAPTDDVYNQILTAYGDASARLSTAESEISSIKADIGSESTSGTIKGRIYTAEMNTQNNTSEIIQTKSRVSTNETDISEIEKEIGDDGEASSIKGRIKTAEGDIDDLERRTGNLEDKASEFESDFVIVDGRLTSLEGSASDAATAISALQTSLKNFGIFDRADYDETTNTIILWFVKNGEKQKFEIPLEDFLNADELEAQITEQVTALAGEYVAQAQTSATEAKNSEVIARGLADKAQYYSEQSEASAQRAANSASEAQAERESAMREANTAGSMAMEASYHASQAKSSADKAEMYSQTSEDRWSVFDKRLTNVENGISADPFVTDDSVAYQKTAPASALPFAAIERVGGMSYKRKNQIPYPYYYTSSTRAGITYTVNSDGSITVNGTATANSIFVISQTIPFPAGSYFLSGCPKNGSNSTYTMYAVIKDSGSYKFDTGNGVSITLAQDTEVTISFMVYNGTTITNAKVYPMLNLGSSALPFEPYFDGIRHTAVTEIESKGKNLFDNGNVNYTAGIGLNFQTYGEYVRINGTKVSGANVIPVAKPNLVIPAGTYALSVRFISGTLTRVDTSVTDDSIMFGINLSGYAHRTSGACFKVGDVGTRIFTITEPLTVSTFDITCGYSGTGNVFDNVVLACQLERAGAVTDFEPYVKETFPITESIRSLPDYGMGINADVNNHIDYENTEYVQMCSERAYQSGDENNPEVVTDGTRTVYALSTPVRTPITFTDNYIRVGGSGTLTFVNEHKLAVPSTVLYLTKEASV